jgi:hypothetical protein
MPADVSVRSRSYSSGNVLLAVALLVLVGLVVASAATLSRRPLVVGTVLVLALVGLAVQAGASDGQLTAAVLLLLFLGALALRAVADLAGSLRPERRRPSVRTRAEREAAARERRRRLAA